MSALQEQAVQMIRSLSEENLRFLIEIIQRLMPPKTKERTLQPDKETGMQAFYRLDAARAEISRYLPENFDPDRELEEARAERYGNID